jgi:hypothetical protein
MHRLKAKRTHKIPINCKAIGNENSLNAVNVMLQ